MAIIYFKCGISIITTNNKIKILKLILSSFHCEVIKFEIKFENLSQV